MVKTTKLIQNVCENTTQTLENVSDIRCVFNCFLKTVILFAVLILKGSSFQSRGAAIANDLLGLVKPSEWCTITLTLSQGWWGRCEKTISRRRKEGRAEKKTCTARPRLEPGTYCMLGEGPQLHATGVV